MKMLMKLAESVGATVSGSDICLGGHDARNVDGADAVVISAAISEDNTELARAKELNLPVFSRAEFLAKISTMYARSVAVAGAHGKTTTTGMLWEVFEQFNPTIHIGGVYNGKTGNIGSRDLFITEACEYKRSFLTLTPDVAIILNIDLDHTDCYRNIDEMRDAFAHFAGSAKTVIINADDLQGGILADFKAAVVDYGHDAGISRTEFVTVGLTKDCDYFATCLNPDKKGRYSFCVHKNWGERSIRLGKISLSVSGRHNVYNALAVIAAAFKFKMSFGCISAGLLRFTGTERRMQLLGYRGGSAIFSDYAHHPREIAMSLLCAKESGYKHISVVFEPHTYSRTKSFLAGFIETLAAADTIILLPVYAARETPSMGIDTIDIAEGLKSCSKDTFYFENYDLAEQFLSKHLHDDGVIVFMGAGSIDSLARSFAKGISAK